MTFYLSVKSPTPAGFDLMTCGTKSSCKIVYRKSYTPRVYYLSPPVIYYESYTEIWFDPKSTMGLVQNLESDELPFVNVEVAGSKLDFEEGVDHETTYTSWWENGARGQVG